MRLNRRGLGTGVLWSRILPAALLLVAAGAAVLSLGSHPKGNGTAPDTRWVSFGRQAQTTPTAAGLGKLPLMFEPNVGQTDPQVRFIARGSNYGLFLTDRDAVLALRHSRGDESKKSATSVLRMKLTGARAGTDVEGVDALPGKSNYLIGNNPAKWRRNVPQYSRVRYSTIYPGVDLVYYGNQGQLEYDFRVAPGADPKNIQLSFEGASGLRLDSGDLLVRTEAGDIRLKAPRVYEEENGSSRQPVNGRFALLAKDRVGFEVGEYDRSRTLVIDPVLTYSTYLGGTGTEMLPSVAVDSGASIYVTGATTSTDFPIVPPGSSNFQPGATSNVFVAKFDPTGATLVFSTYLGGTGADTSVGIAVDAATNVYIAGTTTSTNFPTTSSAFQPAPPPFPGNPHTFISELNAAGSSLLYSSYFSGNQTDTAKGMTLDNKGLVYVIGITNSTNFPLAPTAGTFQSTLQGANAFFISKINPASTGTNSLVFSTYFGGGFPTTGGVTGGAIAVDNNAAGSDIYFTGGTTYQNSGQNAATDFPIRNAFQPCLGNPTATGTCPTGATEPDAFVAKLNPGVNTGPQLLYCTYIGGAHTDIGLGIAVDASGNAYVTGSTNSSDHPAVSGGIAPYQASLNGGTDAFIAKINNPASGASTTTVVLTYFSYLGGSGNDSGNAIVVDSVQGARVVGTTASSDLVTLNPITGGGSLKGPQDAFVARLDTLGTTASTSQFVTLLGGSASETGTGITIDTDSNTYVTGETTSADFPTVSPFQGALKPPQDVFVSKLGPALNFTVTVSSPTANSVNAGNQISFTYTVTNTGDTTSNVAFSDNLAAGSGSAPVTFVSASASGGTCPTTPTDNKVLCNLGVINGGQSSTITVNLTPTGPGTIANSGTVSVGAFTRTAIASPVPVNSFRLTALRSNNTVVAGNPASYPIQITPLSVFTASISIACSAGLPGGGTTCTPSTNPVTLEGSSPSTVTLVISTFPRVTTTAGLSRDRGRFLASLLPVTGLAFLGLGIGSRLNGRRRILGSLFFLALMTLVLFQPACGGHSSTTTTTGTPAGTYTINVSATSGSFSQTTPITLVVQ